MQNLIKITAIAAITLAAFTASGSPSGSLELKTSYADVYGVRDVEAGNYQTGVQKLSQFKAKTSHRGELADINTNLCVAYISQGDLQQATTTCSEAVKMYTSKREKSIAYNNLAVLSYLQGDAKASVENLEMAAYLNPHNDITARNLERVLARSQFASN
ncbi:hypothetical protein HMF8227_01522 [Saliniradius amylolyticus]|uniref:Uncharacterized protein n=1 Tax=Saliniradius amylolyticus TaxID=2183582 RepID=A0A2S2E4S7_9ALTE|nr:tetratricopeptide repeat protein [Saliniradius amylolyticus]AWL11997.1 hypothetical protein HMF8227_01522 [Saliniradius amylolyticus]